MPIHQRGWIDGERASMRSAFDLLSSPDTRIQTKHKLHPWHILVYLCRC
jgi:hypothetical protein